MSVGRFDVWSECLKKVRNYNAHAHASENLLLLVIGTGICIFLNALLLICIVGYNVTFQAL